MSTKTLRKRIALVAVAALGAGVLSVAPASAANNNAVGGANVAPDTDILNVAVAPSITGAAIVLATVEDATTARNFSLGLLANSTTLTTSSLTSTATMRADGEIVFYTKTANDVAATFEVEGGTLGTVAAESGSINSVNASRTAWSTAKATAATQIAFSVKPNTGATSMTVSMYKSGALSTPSQAKVNDVLSGATSKGSLIQRYVVTVATTSLSGAYSPAFSAIRGVASGSVSQTETSNVDASASLTVANAASSAAFININLRDAYNVSLDGKGALTIEATNGAGLKFNADGTVATSGFNLIAVDTDTSGALTVARPAAFANKGFSTTVTVKWNGATVGTKAVRFLGEVAKIVATADAYNLQAGASPAEVGSITYTDDAGNVLAPTSGTSVVSTTLNQFVTGASVSNWADSTDPTSYYDITCAGTATTASGTGSADLVWQHVNAFSGSVVRSAATKVTCSGNPVTYTAALDKATYAPGDIATLTITGKDRLGNLAQGTANLIQSASSGSEFTVTAPQMTPVTAISTSSVLLNSAPGTKTYKFVVGNVEGSYNAVVAIPLINSLLLGGANQTVAYKVAAPAGAVSNADVLKAIVSLIASINKQIAALQKALLRR